MKKYNIVISHTGNDLYTVIVKSFELLEDGTETNINSLIKVEQTLQDCLKLQNDFINGNV